MQFEPDTDRLKTGLQLCSFVIDAMIDPAVAKPVRISTGAIESAREISVVFYVGKRNPRVNV
jgi:hypothetical protein